MTYDFDTPLKRRGTGSYKWDTPAGDDVLPMWVADMDFPTAPAVMQAVERRAAHGAYGYTLVGESYYDAIIRWFAQRHGWAIRRDHLLYTTGVVPAVSCTLRALTMPGENVLVQTPAYNCFFSSIRNQGCQILETRLVEAEGGYRMDFDDFERKCEEEKTTAFLLCNPHNPTGRVWTADELARMGEICARHGVAVVSDEIHCEITRPGVGYVPFASVSEQCARISAVLTSPSKAFNTAGLQIANIVCPNAEWRRRIDRAINIFEVCDVNPFGPVALEAAYSSEGAAWLDALREYIAGNFLTVARFLADEMPAVKLTPAEGTYLAWLDIRATGLASDAAAERLLERGRLMLSSGTLYGREAGEGFLRMNLACPRSRVEEGLRRLKKGLE